MAYPYRLPRRYRRYVSPYAYRRGGVSPAAVLAVAGAVALAAASHAHATAGHPAAGRGTGSGAHTAVAESRAAREAVAFARAQVGDVPYAWGGTTTAGFDCSGLVQAAWASAGVSIQRTSQDQWASEPHVTTPQAVDLVFFAGSDGTPSSPGHVGIVVDPARHLMIDAYATGYDVEYDTYGPGESKPGLDPVVGFTDPAGGA